jgi:acetyltransferase-like isoleucine patch superfamily enzyme
MLYKFTWFLRAIIYRSFFGSFKFPSYIGKPLFIKGSKNIFIGKNVRIFPGVRMEAHNNSKIIIQDNVAIGQNVHITSSDIDLVISSGSVVLGSSFITNIDHDYRALNISVLQQSILVKETKLGENSFVGFGACIQAGTILGKHCIVGANSVVRGNFSDYSVLVGAPAKIVKKFNSSKKKWVKVSR